MVQPLAGGLHHSWAKLLHFSAALPVALGFWGTRALPQLFVVFEPVGQFELSLKLGESLTQVLF